MLQLPPSHVGGALVAQQIEVPLRLDLNIVEPDAPFVSPGRPWPAEGGAERHGGCPARPSVAATGTRRATAALPRH
jgi:hypothetical protein